MENKEILRRRETKICSPECESEIWKAIEVNKELKLNVDEQQHDIKHLKEQSDIDDEYELQKITATITPMKKEKACVCDM